MQKKRVMTLVLSAVLAMSALTACGSSREGAPASAPAATEEKTETAEKKTTKKTK